MRKFIAVLIIAGAVLAGFSLFNYWKDFESGKQSFDAGSTNTPGTEAADPAAPPAPIGGLPKNLEPSLAAAQRAGPAALADWLQKYRRYLKDPKLADIELDYVVMIARQNPAEARKVFETVRRRVRPGSPVYDRVQRLGNTFE
jgi:hypothetical protein